ncbi:MAG: carbohydrate kinase, partial [Calditrichaeota bacterium]
MAGFIGLDFGTGGAKACLMAADGTVLSYAFEELAIIHEHSGWSEHDAHQYWPVACRLVHRCLHDAAVSAADVEGIAVSSALPSMVMVDRSGAPLQRAYNLMDKRAVAIVEWLKEHIGDERIFHLSGYRLEDHPLLVNVLWERKNRPQTFAQIDKVLTIDGYITFKLTGRAVCHYFAAAFYGVAYDLRNGVFNEQMLDELHLSPQILPELVQCDDIIGAISADAAADIGLEAGTLVCGGQVDCNASWLGAGATEIGDFQSNLGTVGNFGIIHQNSDFNFSAVGRLMINFPYTINSADTFVTVPTTLTGGQCLRWIRDQLAPHLRQKGQKSAYDQLTDLAAAVPAGCDGLI